MTPDNIMTGNTNKAYEEIIKYSPMYVSFNDIKKNIFQIVVNNYLYILYKIII